ncbi:hypothetical protein [Vibrio sp. TBV020]|uniref:hypothetical protein n=1 Tax=Vibrio sp. TBV020 TaxID=3137398 RepID=UPI0038CD3D05
MRSNIDGKRIVDRIRIRKQYKCDDFHVNSQVLSVGKDSYSLSKIKRIEARKLGVKENAINIVSLAFILSAATWAFVPQFGLISLALTILIAFFCWRKYELRAEFIGTDETGDHWVSIARGYTEEEFTVFKDIEQLLRHRA